MAHLAPPPPPPAHTVPPAWSPPAHPCTAAGTAAPAAPHCSTWRSRCRGACEIESTAACSHVRMVFYVALRSAAAGSHLMPAGSPSIITPTSAWMSASVKARARQAWVLCSCWRCCSRPAKRPLPLPPPLPAGCQRPGGAACPDARGRVHRSLAPTRARSARCSAAGGVAAAARHRRAGKGMSTSGRKQKCRRRRLQALLERCMESWQHLRPSGVQALQQQSSDISAFRSQLGAPLEAERARLSSLFRCQRFHALSLITSHCGAPGRHSRRVEARRVHCYHRRAPPVAAGGCCRTRHGSVLYLSSGAGRMPQDQDQRDAAAGPAPTAEPVATAASGSGGAGPVEAEAPALPEMVLFRCKEAYGAWPSFGWRRKSPPVARS